jgi:Cd2+/Zn2+-exporting ATPase
MKDSKRFVNGKCRYCGMDEKHCRCGIAEGESCQIGCGDGCACAHSHSHAHGNESFEWKEWIPVVAAGMLLIGSIFLTGTVQTVLRLAAYLLAGYEVLIRAATGFVKGRFFDENVLMSVATIGALVLGEYAEAAAVMIFYGVGEGLQEAAVRSSRKRITDAVELHPDKARRISDDGEQTTVKPEEIAVGETILVKPGERVPLDGEVIGGESLLDVSMLNGEPKPQLAKSGSAVRAGAVNTSGPLTIRITSIAAESSTSRLLRAVEDATKHKPAIERFITRFARVYTPAVIGAAVLLAALPPLFGLGSWSEWIGRALIFLVISCPCALVLSIPLTFFAGLAITSKQGVLFKGADALEQLPQTKAVILDKTGTLTEGEFSVQHVESQELPKEELLALASAAEQNSLHPVAAAIARADTRGYIAENVQEFAGKGVTVLIDGRRIAVGNRTLMQQEGVRTNADASVLVAIDGSYAGAIHVGDRVRASAKAAVGELNALTGYTAILTGDAREPAEAVGGELGVKGVFALLQPEEKLARMREIRSRVGRTLFVGDGINDAPVLAGADIGVAIGDGTDMAAEAADALLLTNDLTRLPFAIRTAKKTVRTAKQNIIIALGIKTIALVLGALGLAGMWIAVVADVGAAIICILHTLTLFYKSKA